MEMQAFPSIDSFHVMRRDNLEYFKSREIKEGLPVVTYQPKIKLHGSNGGVQVTVEGDVYPQSRTSILNPPHTDNAAFGAWVKTQKFPVTGENYVIFGEWFGKGIQSKVACSKIPSKRFAIFSVYLPAQDRMICDPQDICDYLQGYAKIVQTGQDLDDGKFIVLPWYTGPESLDLNDVSAVEKYLVSVNRDVDHVENCDPWIRDVFGVEGIGEGLVYFPTNPQWDHLTTRLFGAYAFKAKGKFHQVNKADKPAMAEVPVLPGITEFVDAYCTEARFEQGLSETGVTRDVRGIGPFLGWVHKDILKESRVSLETSGLTWKQVSSAVTQRTKDWFLGSRT